MTKEFTIYHALYFGGLIYAFGLPIFYYCCEGLDAKRGHNSFVYRYGLIGVGISWILTMIFYGDFIMLRIQESGGI